MTERTKGLSEWCRELHKVSKDSGWWEELNEILSHLPEEYHGTVKAWCYATKIALIHSEVSEMLEGLRKGVKDDHLPHRPMVEVEGADAFIRLADLFGKLRLDLEGAVAEKSAYNQVREDHKKENRDEEGGKKF